MRQVHPLIIICLLASVAALALVFLFIGTTGSGTDPGTGKPEQVPLKNPVIVPVLSTPTIHINASQKNPNPTTSLLSLQTIKKTTVPTQVPAIKPTITPSPQFTGAVAPASANPYTISTNALAQRVHELINQQRTGQGLGVLVFDPALGDIARKHSEDMAAQHFFAHENPAGQDPTERGALAGYTCRKEYGSYYTYGIAENIFQNNLYSSATYYSNRGTVYHWNSPEVIAQTTVAGWMNSSGHRKNILTPTFGRQGIGVAIASDDKVYITEDFC